MADPPEEEKRGGLGGGEMPRDDPRPSAPVCQNVAESLGSGKSTLLDGGAQSGECWSGPARLRVVITGERRLSRATETPQEAL